MQRQREYNGFGITAEAFPLPVGGFGACVTLSREGPVRMQSKFHLPIEEQLATAEEALREAMRYGADLVDGLVPSFDPNDMSS